MIMGMSSDWTEEMRQFVRDTYRRTGHSASSIARDLNHKHRTAFTKNSIIGMARRLGLGSPTGRNRPVPPLKDLAAGT